MGKRTISLCIFDLDGVIVDTAKYHYLAWKKLARSFGFTLTKDHNEQLKGVSRKQSLDQILKWAERSFSEADKKKMTHLKNKWYLERIVQLSKEDTLPGVTDFILELRERNIKTAVGSASKNAQFILKCLNIFPLFDVIVDGNMTDRGKPDPEVFLKGATLTSSPPSETVVFEDAAKGVDAALRADMFAVGIGDPAVLGHADLVIPGFMNFKYVDLVKKVNG